jgi:hypothetical protein
MARNSKTSKSVDTFTHDEARRAHIPTAEYQLLMDERSSAPIRVTYERRNRATEAAEWSVSQTSQQDLQKAN